MQSLQHVSAPMEFLPQGKEKMTEVEVETQMGEGVCMCVGVCRGKGRGGERKDGQEGGQTGGSGSCSPKQRIYKKRPYHTGRLHKTQLHTVTTCVCKCVCISETDRNCRVTGLWLKEEGKKGARTGDKK